MQPLEGRRSTMRGRVIPLLLALLVVASCGKAGASGSTSPNPSLLIPPGFHRWPVWANPLGASSTKVANLSEAEGIVHFTPIAPPEAWGEPAFLEAASPDSSGERDTVAWLYDSEKGDPLYLLIESSPPAKSQASLEDAATCDKEEIGCQQQNFALVSFGDGTHGLLVNGYIARLVDWVQGDVEFILAGPLESFDADTAVKMADELR
jgi:hypothetical protein